MTQLAPDWAELSPELQPICDAARDAVAHYMTGKSVNERGAVMRGMMLGIADVFDNDTIAAGMQSTARGVDNAFAQVMIERAQNA